jgi:hypothetical protein
MFPVIVQERGNLIEIGEEMWKCDNDAADSVHNLILWYPGTRSSNLFSPLYTSYVLCRMS